MRSATTKMLISKHDKTQGLQKSNQFTRNLHIEIIPLLNYLSGSTEFVTMSNPFEVN